VYTYELIKQPITSIVKMGSPIAGEAQDDQSGWSCSLSSDGTIVAISSINNAGNGSQSGHARVYQYTDNNWQQLGSDIDGEATLDQSGWSVSLSADGTILAIGALYNDANGTNSGHVRVYQYTDNNWQQLGSDIAGEYAHDHSGTSVSLSGDGTIVAIGASGNDGNGSSSGHVRVYQYVKGVYTNTWIQVGYDIDGEYAEDNSGYSVSLSSDGTILAIGAIYNDGNGSDSGGVYTYELIKQPITSIVKMGSPIDGEATGDESGRVLTLNSDGTILAIAANSNDGNGSGSGHVRVYQYTDNNWIQLGSDIDGESQGDHSGAGVSLSADGTILAISAYYNAGNGYMSGHVRIYQYTDNNWQQLGSDIDGETGDRSGYSVSLSSDGTIVAISEPHNDANGSDSGRVRVYQYTDNNWIQLVLILVETM